MTISELIENLQSLKAELGDCPIYIVSEDIKVGGDTFAPLDDIYFNPEHEALTLGSTAKMCGDASTPAEAE
jgi:hypothetical protein